eukprot:g35405.t1
MESECPNGVPGHAFRTCVVQLSEIFTDIFNLSLLQSEIPICFKKTTIILVPKKVHAMCLSDYCPVALISTIMKCFKRLVMAHINSSLLVDLDSLQFLSDKIKELIIDYRSKGGHAPININGAEVERIESIKFLGVLHKKVLRLTGVRPVDMTMIQKTQHQFYYRDNK